jgi:hypothetical protein
MFVSGPGEIRTRDFFSAIDEQVGEKGGKAVYYVYFVPKSPYCYSISVPELFPQYEARKAARSPVQRGKIIFPPIFYMISKHGTARTLNQWLKRTNCKKLCWQPRACRFMPIHWMGGKKSLLVAYGYIF